jgi:outer membrane protein OmpA-like peptidoglycan-associated protein
VKTMSAVLIPIAAIVAVSCATTTPQELVDARSAYDRASVGPAVQLAPAELHAAWENLRQAETSLSDHGDTVQTRDLAYAAQRRAELADVHARTVLTQQTQSSAVAQLSKMKDDQVSLTSAALSVTTQELTAERQRRQAAEQWAAQASADLQQIASVKQDARGVVITLSGSVLFESAKAELLPAAQAKLSEVANVLTQQDPDSRMRVEGYTDSQGALAFNQELSQRRAESVKNYLLAHGIAADRITAQGFGPANPVANNTSPEGRADNRRVEIVVEPPARGMGTTR